MTKSTNLYSRIESEIKEQAEKIPDRTVIDISMLDTEELHAELEKGYADMKAGRTEDAKTAFAKIRKDYGF